MTLVWWLLATVLTLIALLAVPLDLSFSFTVSGGVRGQVRVGWLFGLIRIPIALSPVSSARRETTRRHREPERTSAGRRGLTLLRRGEFWRWLQRLLRKVLRRVRIRQLSLHLRLGLGDPADTGLLWATAGPVAALLGSIRLADIRLEPNFTEAELWLESRGWLRVYPLLLIATVLATALSPATWRLFQQRA